MQVSGIAAQAEQERGEGPLQLLPSFSNAAAEDTNEVRHLHRKMQ